MSGKSRRYGRPAEKTGPSLPLPPRELNLAQQDWVSSGAGLDPTPSRTPGSHGVGSNIETAHVQARAAPEVSSRPSSWVRGPQGLEIGDRRLERLGLGEPCDSQRQFVQLLLLY